MPLWDKTSKAPPQLNQANNRHVIATDKGWLRRTNYTDAAGNPRTKEELLVAIQSLANSTNMGLPAIREVYHTFEEEGSVYKDVKTFVVFDEPITIRSNTFSTLAIGNTASGNSIVGHSNGTVVGANNIIAFHWHPKEFGTYKIDTQIVSNSSPIHSLNEGGETANLTIHSTVSVASPAIILASKNRLWTPALIRDRLGPWYDCSNSSTISVDPDAITRAVELRDLSGKGYHMIQPSAPAAPKTYERNLNGLNVLDFTPTEYMYDNENGNVQPGAFDSTVLIALRYDVQQNSRIFTGYSGTNATRFGFSTAATSMSYTHDSSFTQTQIVLPTGNHIIGGYKEGIETGIGLDGGSGATYSTANNGGTAPTLDNWALGARFINSDHFNGAIGEIVVVLDHSIEERQRIEGYLAHKWGMSANLHSSHPYKSFAPTH